MYRHPAQAAPRRVGSLLELPGYILPQSGIGINQQKHKYAIVHLFYKKKDGDWQKNDNWGLNAV